MGRRRSSKYDFYAYLIIIAIAVIVFILRGIYYLICELINVINEQIINYRNSLIYLWSIPAQRIKIIIIFSAIIISLILLTIILIKHHKKVQKEKAEFYKKLEEEERRRQEAIRQAAEARERERLRKEYQYGYRDDMTGYEYEKYCADLFKYFNWNAVATKKSGDFGADVIATKDGIKIVAQCKKWKGSVGFDAVKEVFTAKTINKADYALVITNSHFSVAARKGAKDTGVILVRHADLEDCLNNLLKY